MASNVDKSQHNRVSNLYHYSEEPENEATQGCLGFGILLMLKNKILVLDWKAMRLQVQLLLIYYYKIMKFVQPELLLDCWEGFTI